MDLVPVYERLQTAAGSREHIYRLLRELPIDIVGNLLMHIPREYGLVRDALPRMAADEVQIGWTGASGHILLMQSCAFVRAVESGYWRHRGRSLDDKRILDYGCGWGRLIRLMYKFTAPEKIYGCDPSDHALQLCLECGIEAQLARCDYLPVDTAFPGVKFDLVYAFSVFTHLSQRAAKAVLGACRKAVADDGLLVVTVRPQSYWDYHQQSQNKVDREQMKRDHSASGFAFTPHPWKPVDGDITYGDTSISLDYIRRNWTDWEVAGIDSFLQDPFQTLVFLKPRG